MAKKPTAKPAASAAELQRPAAEVLYADELDRLAAADSARPRPKGWRLTPRSVLGFVLGSDELGTRPKFVGGRAFLERAIVALATNRGLMLIGEPGTAKSYLSELLAAAISGDSTLTIQGGQRRVIEQLMEKLSRPLQQPFLGAINRRRSPLKIAKNFDAETTVRRNLKYFDPESQRLFIRTPYFHSRVRRHVDRWQIIVLVDESGSMADSVIHSAVTAAVFFGIKCIRTHLVLFDTDVVDVTEHCGDPVETVMKVQLGGGTDIGRALHYASGLVDNPRRTIVILISDFYEGAPAERLLSTAKRLIESGVTLLGLAALDDRAEPNYDRAMAERFVAMGAHVGAMTPGELAEWVAQKVR